MKWITRKKADRRGSALITSGIMLPILLAMAGFSIDTAYIVVVNGQLQFAADSAALAGASALFQPQLQAQLGTSTSSLQTAAIAAARSKARQFAALNSAGSVQVTIPSDRDSDIVVGYQSSPGGSVATNSSNFPNAVQVTVRRDSLANGPLPLFFSPMFGVSTWSGSRTATAAVQGDNITSFKSIPGVNGSLLPIAVDVSFWNTLLSQGTSPDGQKHDSYTVTFPKANPDGTIPKGTVTPGGDGTPELTDVYGDKLSPGNFGLIDIGPDTSSDSTISSWILNGPTSSDIQSLLSRNLLPITLSGSKQWTAGPGLKSNLVDDLAKVAGQPRVVPLFSSVNGNGSNTTYTVVGFAGVTVVSATADGSNISVTIQPSIVVDPTAVSSPSTGTGAVTGNSDLVYAANHLKLTN